MFIIDCARIPALTGARQTRPTSIRRPSLRRHEFSAAGCWMRLRSGYRPPCVTPNTRRHQTSETRRSATYHSRETVQTTGASSLAEIAPKALARFADALKSKRVLDARKRMPLTAQALGARFA